MRPADGLMCLEILGLQKSITSWRESVGELGEEEGGVVESIISDLVVPWF